jgi:serine/threonine protein kinase
MSTNLLLQGGAAKVADFGLAKALKGMVQDMSFSMTPAYAPPELFGGSTAPTSDQYSLGVTYYELRTGRRPFAGTLPRSCTAI